MRKGGQPHTRCKAVCLGHTREVIYTPPSELTKLLKVSEIKYNIEKVWWSNHFHLTFYLSLLLRFMFLKIQLTQKIYILSFFSPLMLLIFFSEDNQSIQQFKKGLTYIFVIY